MGKGEEEGSVFRVCVEGDGGGGMIGKGEEEGSVFLANSNCRAICGEICPHGEQMTNAMNAASYFRLH